MSNKPKRLKIIGRSWNESSTNLGLFSVHEQQKKTQTGSWFGISVCTWHLFMNARLPAGQCVEADFTEQRSHVPPTSTIPRLIPQVDIHSLIQKSHWALSCGCRDMLSDTPNWPCSKTFLFFFPKTRRFKLLLVFFFVAFFTFPGFEHECKSNASKLFLDSLEKWMLAETYSIPIYCNKKW